MTVSIELFLLVVIPLILIAAGGCALCWRIAGKKSYLRGYEARKEEAEAVFGSAEAEGKRIVSEAVKDGENKKRECLLQAKEETVDTVKAELDKYLTQYEQQWSTYLPAQYELVKNRKAAVVGNTIYVIIAENAEALATEITK